MSCIVTCKGCSEVWSIWLELVVFTVTLRIYLFCKNGSPAQLRMRNKVGACNLFRESGMNLYLVSFVGLKRERERERDDIKERDQLTCSQKDTPFLFLFVCYTYTYTIALKLDGPFEEVSLQLLLLQTLVGKKEKQFCISGICESYFHFSLATSTPFPPSFHAYSYKYQKKIYYY